MIVPIGIFFGLILSVVIFAPDANPLLTDPYTAWKNYTEGERVVAPPSGNGDRDSIFPVSNSLSGYSRNSSELGGSFDFDHSPVMTVTTSYPYYWRGETKAYYNGQGWNNRISMDTGLPELTFITGETALPDPQGSSEGYPSVNKSKLKTREVQQTIEFSVSSSLPYPVLFGAPTIKTIEILETMDLEVQETVNELVRYLELDQEKDLDDDFSLVWLPPLGEIHYIASGAAFPNKYHLISEVPIINEYALREAKPIDGDYFGEWDKYLQLPESLPERVVSLSEEITEEYGNSYDKVKAIETFLRDTYTYSTTPDDSKGTSPDFVDRFLFEIEEGYCDYFSTSMVVLARAVGIPARWVKGFTEGTRQEDPMELIEANDYGAPGIFSVTNSNAHSWVEIYFEGFGWIPFEPTPSFSAPVVTEMDSVEDGRQEEEDSSLEAGYEASNTNYKSILLYISGMLGSVALLFYLSYLFKKSINSFRPRWRKKANFSPNEMIVLELESLLNYGRKKGYKVNEYDTLAETFRNWGEDNPSLTPYLKGLMAIFNKAVYSNEKLGQKDLEFVEEKVTAIKGIIKQNQQR
ncbi:MAG: transglutaminase-like domain-containing protein [Bacillus sp. (in: Bacteria)]|nr:transglutaminase-like domain-containing protein [Bacillus sp. (in: firmicutes)]